MKFFMGVEDPTCGIVNIGAEEEKGNALVKETFPLLKECKDIRFVGSVEARDIPRNPEQENMAGTMKVYVLAMDGQDPVFTRVVR